MNYTDFLNEQKAREERVAARKNAANNKKFVRYFSLKDNGDEALVRFMHEDMNDFEIFHTHNVNVDGKFKRVKCLRENYSEPQSVCPLCASGNRAQDRTYIKLIEYVKQDDGTVSAEPRIWERPAQFLQTVANRFADYGNVVYKIKRIGARGDMKTTYDLLPANASLYNDMTCPKETTLFEGYSVEGTRTFDPLQIKTADEMKVMLGELPAEVAKPKPQASAPDFSRGTPFPSMYNNEQYGDPDKVVNTFTFGGQKRVQY